MQQYNILKLLQLFDKHIYSNINNQNQTEEINTFISKDDLEIFFESALELIKSLKIYSQTIIQVSNPNEDFFHLLVNTYTVTDLGLNITHNLTALKLYLYRKDNATIHNGAIQLLLAKAFAKYAFNGELIYSFLSKGYCFKCTPDELRLLLQMNYQNSFLLPRVLRPAEESIKRLFENSKLPFYLTIELEKSMLGTGRKIIGIRFIINDYVVALRQARLRDTYLGSIFNALKQLFPWDFPFYNHEIELLNDSTVEQIHDVIKNIETDSDYGKIETSTLVRYKLQEDFGVRIKID